MKYLNTPEFEKPIAVLSDITMPGISGYDLALEVRKKSPFQIIIFISGNADLLHHEYATREVCHILSKPFREDELLSMLKNLVLPCYKHLNTKNETASKCVNIALVKCPFCTPH